MKTIQLTHIRVSNFKGEVSLDQEIYKRTLVQGENRTGKTTLTDAYYWCLFGKDSDGNTDFEIKPLDKDNNPIHKLVTEVQLTFDSGKRFKKRFFEKWQRKRGSENEELTGHETEYFVNDTPKSKSEYENEVNDFISYGNSRLLSDTKYFNEVIKWNERRELLFQLADEITDAEILNSTESNLFEVVKILNEGKTISDEKKRVSAIKKKLNDNLKLIPTRINECRFISEDLLKFECDNSVIEHITNIIDKLKKKQSEISQEILNLERIEIQIQEFENQRMKLVVDSINDKFAFVKFKITNKKLNGSIDQTCVPMIDGVPYKSLNNAGKIIASLDIINTFQHHLGIFAPIFIDNSESITDIPLLECQQILLEVKKNEKKLNFSCID